MEPPFRLYLIKLRSSNNYYPAAPSRSLHSAFRKWRYELRFYFCVNSGKYHVVGELIGRGHFNQKVIFQGCCRIDNYDGAILREEVLQEPNKPRENSMGDLPESNLMREQSTFGRGEQLLVTHVSCQDGRSNVFYKLIHFLIEREKNVNRYK